MRPKRAAKVEALQRIIAQNRGKTVVETQSAGKDLRRKRTPIVDVSDDNETAITDKEVVCRKMAYKSFID